MNISNEQIAPNIYILRGHADGDGYGDDFSWACIAIINGKMATIKALVADAGETYNGITDDEEMEVKELNFE